MHRHLLYYLGIRISSSVASESAYVLWRCKRVSRRTNNSLNRTQTTPQGLVDVSPNSAIWLKQQTIRMWLSELQKYGTAFTAAGAFFFLLGVLTFFDAAFLAMGNVSVAYLIGLSPLIEPDGVFRSTNTSYSSSLSLVSFVSSVLNVQLSSSHDQQRSGAPSPSCLASF